MKLLVAGGGTGGHLMPALALAEALVALRGDLDIVLVGARRGIEADLLAGYPYRYHLLPAEPLYRGAWWRNLRWAFLLPGLVRAANRVLTLERPRAAIGTGGYAAGPVLWRAQGLGLPTVLQEQNAFPGLTTRALARRARQVHLGFPEAAPRLRTGRETRVFTFGNPIRGGAAANTPGHAGTARRAFGLDPARPCVFLFGGSQGARALNQALAGALERGLLPDLSVLWGTGDAQADRFTPLGVPGRVVVRGFFDPIEQAYRASDLVVCRAGAMTVAELCAFGKPSVLVPYPRAAADHQTHNARALAEAGAGVLLPEIELTPLSLANTIQSLVRAPSRLALYGREARARGHPDAARCIASTILTLLE